MPRKKVLAAPSWRAPATPFTELDRQRIYTSCGLTIGQTSELETMVLGSPARAVGQGALKNMRGLLPSKKNGGVRLFESHTVERLCLYELELDPGVRAYYVQVPCTGVIHTAPTGRTYVSTATLDVLVLRDDAITLLECKDRDWLEKELGLHGWTCTNGRWTREPYEHWARERGIKFEVWTPPYPSAIYLRNLEAVYALLGEPLTERQRIAADDALEALAKHTHSVAALCSLNEAFTPRVVLWLLAHRKAHGLVRSFPITDRDQFILFSSKVDAETADAQILKQRAESLEQPVFNDALHTASSTALEAARRRLARLDAISVGEARPTRRMTALAKSVAEVVSQGTSPLAACLASYQKSGNRTSRLTKGQREKLQETANTWQREGAPHAVEDAWHQLKTSCDDAGIVTPSRTTLKRVLRALDPARRALATGGLRAYQAIAPRSDPRHRSGRALGFGHTLHIDSSKRDIRSGPELQALMGARTAAKHVDDGRTYDTFYLAVDEATEYPVAHAFVIGPARIDAEAILIRQFVHCHHMLPRAINVDRGPENVSLWLKEFCLHYGITLTHSMTSASRANSQAEFVIGQLNKRVSHKLPGSTAPDMAGRKVDSRFKSRETAKLDFMVICKELESFLYEDMPNLPKSDGLTPARRKLEVLESLGAMGTPHELDDDLMISTSPRWTRPYSCSEQRGIRLYNHGYTSRELRLPLRTGKPEELRLDAVDPSVVYARFAGQWVKAFHARTQVIATLPFLEKFWLQLIEPKIQSDGRQEKSTQSHKLHTRLQRAQQGAPASKHLAPTANDAAATTAREDLADTPDAWDEEWAASEPVPEEDA